MNPPSVSAKQSQVVADLSIELPQLKTFVTLSPIPGLRQWITGQQPAPTDGDAWRARAAQYLLSAKRDDGLPLDPVARFHLGNGALIHQVHADADTSEKGLQQSAGVMVNYLYDPQQVLQNHERFASSHHIAASQHIRSLNAIAEKAMSEDQKT